MDDSELAAAIALLIEEGRENEAAILLAAELEEEGLEEEAVLLIAATVISWLLVPIPSLPGLPDIELPDAPRLRDNPSIREGIRSALFGLNAARRVARDVLKGKSVSESLAKERKNYDLHKEAQRQRRAVDSMISGAIEVYGPILSWHAVERETSRPSHLRANGKNWDARRTPTQTGGRPGELPNCLCYVGPPIPGARLLR